MLINFGSLLFPVRSSRRLLLLQIMTHASSSYPKRVHCISNPISLTLSMVHESCSDARAIAAFPALLHIKWMHAGRNLQTFSNSTLVDSLEVKVLHLATHILQLFCSSMRPCLLQGKASAFLCKLTVLQAQDPGIQNVTIVWDLTIFH